MEVTLMQMLEARERRVWEQQSLIRQFGRPIICFTMNIPGPVKDSPLIRRSFDWGRAALEYRIPKAKLLSSSVQYEVTGCQALYAADLTAVELKRICVSIEDASPVGRLFDMDVLDETGTKLDREQVGGGSRDCIVCGAPGRGCASRRIHTVPELQAAANRLMREHFARLDADRIGALAVRSLLDEVCTTPKPGLVDRRNSGSHRDMDIFTFVASAASLKDYFTSCADIGIRTSQSAPEDTFAALRLAGLTAEQRMLEATGGVNTHKGAIFTMGILCGAAGRLWQPDAPIPEAQLFEMVSAMTREAMEGDWNHSDWNTAGESLYRSAGIRGVRGEAAMGLPSVRQIGLPVYRRELHRLGNRNDAGVLTLLHLITRVQDTNLLHRGGPEKAAQAVQMTRKLLELDPNQDQLHQLDDWFIRENLSPGGCADLLAAVYFVSDLTEGSV